jgi:VWFA-related protein
VVLDVTVLDKSGHPVTTGLKKDDFLITEEKQPQEMFSFEAPQEHVASGDDESGLSNAPTTILVLDQLNDSVDEFTLLQKAAHDYLAAQPATLPTPTEVLVATNTSLEMVQGYTRSRDDLIFAVDHVSPANAFKFAKSDFDSERARQSIDNLKQIAVQNRGIPGRKNVLWLGRGGPNLNRAAYGTMLDGWSQYVHAAANLLVEARVSLFIVFPQLKAINTHGVTLQQTDHDANYGNNGPFTGDVNFALFAKETGGSLLFNRNDLSMEVDEAVTLGSNYYTLTYRPSQDAIDGKFRSVHVTTRNRDLHVITKIGYFSLPKNAPDPQQQIAIDMYDAAATTLPMHALELSVSDAVRQSDTRTVHFVLHVKPSHLGWAGENGTKQANLVLGLLSLSRGKRILASRFETVQLHSSAADPDAVQEEVRFKLTARIPPKTQMVRIVLRVSENGRTGTADLSEKMLTDAPEVTAGSSRK